MQIVLQSEAVEWAFASLAMVAIAHGLHVDLVYLRRRVPVLLKSVTLQQLITHAGAVTQESHLGNDFSKISQAHDECIDSGKQRASCDAQMIAGMAAYCATSGNLACGTAASIYGWAIGVGTFFDNLEKAKWVAGNPMGDGWGGGAPP
jgi:hypothetical protein